MWVKLTDRYQSSQLHLSSGANSDRQLDRNYFTPACHERFISAGLPYFPNTSSLLQTTETLLAITM